MLFENFRIEEDGSESCHRADMGVSAKDYFVENDAIYASQVCGAGTHTLWEAWRAVGAPHVFTTHFLGQKSHWRARFSAQVSQFAAPDGSQCDRLQLTALQEVAISLSELVSAYVHEFGFGPDHAHLVEPNGQVLGHLSFEDSRQVYTRSNTPDIYWTGGYSYPTVGYETYEKGWAIALDG